MIALTLPWPPSANTYYRNFNGRMVLSEAGRKYRNEVAAIFNGIKQEGRLAMFASLYPPNRRKFDCDNRIKALQDALQYAGVFDDDEQIDALAVFREEIVPGGMCKVLIVQADQKRETVIVDLTKFAVKQVEAA
jgi:crossover junction endodeoxyribonuclease RusA